MWIPGWISLPSPSDDDDDRRSRDDDRKPGRPGDPGASPPDAPTDDDRATFERLLHSAPERQETPERPTTRTADERPRDPRSEPESDRPDEPREDRDDPGGRRLPGRSELPAPGAHRDLGGDPQPVYGQGSGGHGSGGHESGGHQSGGHQSGGHGHGGGGSGQDLTPGMLILGAMQGTPEPTLNPSAGDDEKRLGALLREVVDVVWSTNPAARGQAAVHLQITEKTLPHTSIDLAMKDGELLVTITTGTPEVEQFLAGRLGDLRDRLASRLRGRSVRVELARGRLEGAGASAEDRDEPVRPGEDQGR